MALDVWAFVVSLCLFGLGTLWSAARVIASSRAKAQHIKRGLVHGTTGAVQITNPQNKSVIYAATFIPSDLRELDHMTGLAATSLVSNPGLTNADHAKSARNYWTWVKPFDVSIAILFGLIFSGVVGVGVTVSSYVDIGSFVRSDGIETFWLGHLGWGIVFAIVTCTCLWSTGSYKYPAHFQTILVVGLCAFSAGLSLALGSLATDGRQYVGFAFGAFFTVCVGVFGLYDLFIYMNQRNMELLGYVNALRFVYGVAVIVALARHVILVLSPEYSGAIVLPIVASDIQFMIDSIAFVVIALSFFRARMELYRALTGLSLHVFNIRPDLYVAPSSPMPMQQFYYTNPYASVQPQPYPYSQQPFMPPSQGVTNVYTGMPYGSSVVPAQPQPM